MQIKNLVQKLKKQILGRLPERLPQSEQALEEFAVAVCELGGFPANDSFVQAIASQMQHMDMNTTHVRKINFVNALRRAVAQQTAFNVLQAIKEKQNAARLQDAASAVV